MHIPIMCNEILEFIIQKKPKKIIDCTFGFGGHSRLFLEHNINVIALDRDVTTQLYADKLKSEFKDQFSFHVIEFSNIDTITNQNVDLVFADLGMSTMQLENARGFSFLIDSELDMRMSNQGLKLKQIINKMPRYKIAEIIKNFGEEKQFNKISSNIIHYRLKKEINTTFNFKDAIGFNNYKILARVFQAFRIYINKELCELQKLLEKIPPMVNQGTIILTFHSLEDRLVKNSFKHYVHNGFKTPTQSEIIKNSKSKNTKLRFGFTKN